MDRSPGQHGPVARSAAAALVLYKPILDETDFILGSGEDGRIQLGALLEVLLMNGGARAIRAFAQLPLVAVRVGLKEWNPAVCELAGP